jgi:hypothetical protein
MSELRARCSKAPVIISTKFLSFRPLNRISIFVSKVLVEIGRFFSFLMYTQSARLLGRGISPSQGRYLHTEHKHGINAQTSMSPVGFEPMIPVLGRAITVHALDSAATVVS